FVESDGLIGMTELAMGFGDVEEDLRAREDSIRALVLRKRLSKLVLLKERVAVVEHMRGLGLRVRGVFGRFVRGRLVLLCDRQREDQEGRDHRSSPPKRRLSFFFFLLVLDES